MDDFSTRSVPPTRADINETPEPHATSPTVSAAVEQAAAIAPLPVEPESPARSLDMNVAQGFSLNEQHLHLSELLRVKMAWAKLLWLLVFLAILLAVAYTVPFLAEQTQYAITRGKQRAEHEIAEVELQGSPLKQISRSYQMVAKRVWPSVVHINTLGTESDLLSTGLPLRRPGFGRMPTEGQGSGFIADAEGHIVTNYHVIRDAREIVVSLGDGRRVPGKVIGYDKETDLALLKISSDKITPAIWGDSEQTEVGSLVWAIGSPFGLERSITSGILSQKHRAGMAGTPYQDFLQVDAAVNPGNSGGPLVDDEGRVVGVNTAIVGEGFQGIAFAIPSNEAREVYERLKGDGQVRRGWLGVALDTVTAARAKELKVPQARGAYVASVVDQPGLPSPAAEAGIQAGDVVIRWNESEVTDPAALSNLVARTSIGSKAVIIVIRDGQQSSLEVTVAERPKQ